MPSLPPHVTAPATMLPGNIVPFVDEQTVPAEFDGTLPAPPPPPRPTGPSCTSGQLVGSLPKWVPKSANNDGERMDPVLAASLYGWVVVTNVSDQPCTLQGRTDVQFVDVTGPLNMDYGDNIRAQAGGKIGVPPGAQASLRLDWSAPFCGAVTGHLDVKVGLPHGGGTLLAPVGDPTVPGCLHEENHPEYTTGVLVGAFEPGNDSTPTALPTSKLSVLEVSIVSRPTKGSPGKAIRYIVALTNPTGDPVPLTGPVGFGQFIASRGGDGVAPFQYPIVFGLNRRVVTAIPAHGSVRYEMLLTVPAVMKHGLKMSVNWLLAAPWLDSQPTPTDGFTITVT